jgi:hypothetical protein
MERGLSSPLAVWVSDAISKRSGSSALHVSELLMERGLSSPLAVWIGDAISKRSGSSAS